MKNLRISVLSLVMMIAIVATSCSGSKSSEGSSANPELWKALTASDWAAWTGVTGCEMKFIGDDKVIVMEWSQDTVTKAWNRTVSDVGTIEFTGENWFVVKYSNKSLAYLYSANSSTFESSFGNIFRKSKINAFGSKN